MLNITDNSIAEKVDLSQYAGSEYIKLPEANKMLTWWLMGFLMLTLIIFFLPWTQNIQMKGKVTTLLPEHRPQKVNSTIAGRIEHWYVREGDLVQAGDTLVFLSEVKSEYFDPDLIDRTRRQVDNKQASADNYGLKAEALVGQIAAMRRELEAKKEQLDNKVNQTKLKIESNEAAVQQAQVDYDVAEFQLRRTDTLFQKGIKSLSDLEAKRLKMQKTNAKLISARNKLAESRNELNIAQLQRSNVTNEYQTKISKAESDRFSTLSDQFKTEGEVNKLETQYAGYSARSSFYYIIAPQSGYITKTLKSGIGEIIKEGADLLTIVPIERELAVELYVRPMDLPLIEQGQKVRLIFDGWQAFVVSGWSNLTFGTYESDIVAIDNVPNEKSEYRILVRSTDPEMPFPDLLRVGAGAQGIALLNDVPVWYEIWRQLNGFPPDFYEEELKAKEDKFKPPVKAVAK